MPQTLTRRLSLLAPACSIEAADADARTLRGIAVPYGQTGHTSAGPLIVDAGAISLPSALRGVKLFREHGRTTPIGYGIDASDNDEALRMAFALARTPDGDLALIEAAEGLRDAFSVELANVQVEAGHVVSADLVAVAQVAIPAFAGALVNAALSDDDEAAVRAAAQTILDLTTPTEDEAPPEDTNPDAGAADATRTEATMTRSTLTGMAGKPAPARRPRTNGAKVWAAAAADVLRGATDAAQVNAALADITPADSDPDSVFPRPAWIGELWEPERIRRPLVDAIGVQPLTSMTMQGWKFEESPEVGPYAGNKEEIPTNQVSIVPAEAPAQRIAGGWDIDRIYFDFNTGFLEAFQRAAARDYANKSEQYLIDGHAAVVGPPAVPAYPGIAAGAEDLGDVDSAIAGVEAVVAYLVGNGASVDFLIMAGDVFASFLNLTGNEAPWWLAGQGVVGLGGNADVAGTAFLVDPNMTPGQVMGGDRDAVSFWETGPINVTAVNLPNGGIDFALFGYYASLVQDNDGLAIANVTGLEAAAAVARKRATSKSTSSS